MRSTDASRRTLSNDPRQLVDQRHDRKPGHLEQLHRFADDQVLQSAMRAPRPYSSSDDGELVFAGQARRDRNRGPGRPPRIPTSERPGPHRDDLDVVVQRAGQRPHQVQRKQLRAVESARRATRTTIGCSVVRPGKLLAARRRWPAGRHSRSAIRLEMRPFRPLVPGVDEDERLVGARDAARCSGRRSQPFLVARRRGVGEDWRRGRAGAPRCPTSASRCGTAR